MGLRYKLKKLRVKMNNSKQKDLDLDDVQKRAVDIVIQMINDKNSNLLVDQAIGRRGVKNKDIFINIKSNKLIIVNGVFQYEVPIDDRIYDHLIDKFHNKLTRTFNAVENQSTEKTKNSLDTIIIDISETK